MGRENARVWAVMRPFNAIQVWHSRIIQTPVPPQPLVPFAALAMALGSGKTVFLREDDRKMEPLYIPKVNAAKELAEISKDFTNPRELIRETISRFRGRDRYR